MNDPIINMADAEQRFRDLFGKEELKQARNKYHANRILKPYVQYLEEETERKLREQDNE